MNVSAQDKSTGKQNKITITNDKGRLSKDDIERMVKEAAQYEKEDEAQRQRVQAKNSLESYAFNMRQTINDESVKDKLNESDRKKIADKCEETIKWLEANQSAEKVSALSVAIVLAIFLEIDWIFQILKYLCRFLNKSKPQCKLQDEFEDHQKELETVCNPIVKKMYEAAGGAGGMPGGMPSGMPGAGSAKAGHGGSGGPTIEEVD